MMHNERLKELLWNRLSLVFLQTLFNQLIPDHLSDGFQSPYHLIPQNSTFINTVVDFTFSGYARWDGQYFLHIATLGYTHENCLAFFPAYPLLTQFPATIISYLSLNSLSWWNSCLLGSLFLNVTSFYFAAKYLYLITLKLFGSPKFALLTWKVFCFSPATVFFLAPYSESLFSALTFVGIYCCINNSFILASIFFGLSSATRSNGLINLGFLLYFSIKEALFTKKRNPLNVIGTTTFSAILVTLPFLCYQYYAYKLFCHPFYHDGTPSVIQEYLISRNFTIPGKRVPYWCEHSVPFSYSKIQSQYWNVGFLKYFEWKQLPNFLLAFPILFFVSLYVFTCAKANLLHLIQGRSHSGGNRHLFLRPDVDLAFAAHSTFLAVFTFFFAHVQISTRLIGSSSPVLYWMMSHLLGGGKKEDVKISPFIHKWNPLQKELSFRGRLVMYYCWIYVVIGTAMFVNHLPWT